MNQYYLKRLFLSIIVVLRFQLSLVFRPVFKTITSTCKRIRFQAMSRTSVDMTSKCKDMLANQKPEDKQKWPIPRNGSTPTTMCFFCLQCMGKSCA